MFDDETHFDFQATAVLQNVEIFIIFLLLRFYVKSILGILESRCAKCTIFMHLEALNYVFHEFCTSLSLRKKAFLELL